MHSLSHTPVFDSYLKKKNGTLLVFAQQTWHFKEPYLWKAIKPNIWRHTPNKGFKALRLFCFQKINKKCLKLSCWTNKVEPAENCLLIATTVVACCHMRRTRLWCIIWDTLSKPNQSYLHLLFDVANIHERKIIASVCRLLLHDLPIRSGHVHVSSTPKFLSGHADCSFENPAEKFLPNDQIYLAQSTKKLKCWIRISVEDRQKPFAQKRQKKLVCHAERFLDRNSSEHKARDLGKRGTIFYREKKREDAHVAAVFWEGENLWLKHALKSWGEFRDLKIVFWIGPVEVLLKDRLFVG